MALSKKVMQILILFHLTYVHYYVSLQASYLENVVPKRNKKYQYSLGIIN